MKRIKGCNVTGHVTLNMLKTHLESTDYFSFTFIHKHLDDPFKGRTIIFVSDKINLY